MKSTVQLILRTDAAQQHKLEALQAAFANACNALGPFVQRTRCWNRVALHHLAYKQLREAFPDLGSQMACNAIYSVSRASRRIFQHPASPFHVGKLGKAPLPLLQFTPRAPVYFDRHTLSIRHGEASMFTLDGRMRFKLDLGPDDERRFREERLREVVLTRSRAGFVLTFAFAARDDAATGGSTDAASDGSTAADSSDTDAPEYIVVIDNPPPAAPPPAAPPPARALTGAPAP